VLFFLFEVLDLGLEFDEFFLVGGEVVLHLLDKS